MIRRFPNGETHRKVSCGEYIAAGGEPGNAGRLPAEHIGRVERTRGSETSQYPLEEKANAIPRVAASEKGRV